MTSIMKSKTLAAFGASTTGIQSPGAKKSETKIHEMYQTQHKKELTRLEFIEKHMPNCSNNLVVIPSNKDGRCFLRKQYKTVVLEGFIDEEEFENVVQGATKVCEKSYTMKRYNDTKNMGLTKFQVYFFIISAILVFLSELLIYIGGRFGVGEIKWAGLFVILILFCIISVYTNYKIFKVSKIDPSYEKMVRKGLRKYFLEVNQNHEEKGMWWKTVPGAYWIELRLDPAFLDESERLRRAQVKNAKYFGQAPRSMQSNEFSIYTEGDEDMKEETILKSIQDHDILTPVKRVIKEEDESAEDHSSI